MGSAKVRQAVLLLLALGGVACGPIFLAAGIGAGVGLGAGSGGGHGSNAPAPPPLPTGPATAATSVTLGTAGLGPAVFVGQTTVFSLDVIANPVDDGVVQQTIEVTLVVTQGQAVVSPASFTLSGAPAFYESVSLTPTAAGPIGITCSVTGLPVSNGPFTASTLAVAVKPSAFTSNGYMGVGILPSGLVLADLGSGAMDALVATPNADLVTLYAGRGDGTFVQSSTFATGGGPVALAVGHVASHPALDLVVANSTSNSVSVLLGNGAGGFAPRVDFATDVGPQSVALADMNGDGHLDILTGNLAGSVTILFGDGTGAFPSRSDQAVSPIVSVVVAVVSDLNGDGIPDVVYSGVPTFAEQYLALGGFVNNGAGNLSSQNWSSLPIFSGGPDNPGGVALAGAPIGSQPLFASGCISNDEFIGAALNVFYGGSGGAVPSVAMLGTGLIAPPVAIRFADLNGDGFIDIVELRSTGEVLVWLGYDSTGSHYIQAPGSQSLAALPDSTLLHPAAIDVADVNGDGLPDIVVLSTDSGGGGTLTVFLQQP